MDFYYEEEASNLNEQKDGEKESEVQRDEKTNEVFNKLEDNLNNAYEKTTKSLKSMISESSDGLKLNLPVDEATSEKAQAYLTALDSNLANMENIATSYWEQVKKPSFWSNISENISSKLDNVVQLTADTSELNANDSTTNQKGEQDIAGNRTEAELKDLSTNKNIYLKNLKQIDSNIDIESKTELISDILKENQNLEKLMNQIVPQEVSYLEFWKIYFSKKYEILKREEKRREILKASAKNNKEEEIGWDDDEEEEETAEVKEQIKPKSNEKKPKNIQKIKESIKEESPVIISKEDVEEVVGKKKDTTDVVDKEEDEDEEDDWE